MYSYIFSTVSLFPKYKLKTKYENKNHLHYQAKSIHLLQLS